MNVSRKIKSAALWPVAALVVFVLFVYGMSRGLRKGFTRDRQLSIALRPVRGRTS